MKITFPHMGHSYIGLKCLFENLGWEVVVPPLPNKRTLDLGVRYAPELACLPLKINVGNLLEALEMGADTVIMAGGTGPCRFGYYGHVQKEILEDLNYKVKFIILEPPQGGWWKLWQDLKQITNKVSWQQCLFAFHFAWEKLKLLDELDKLALVKRPHELVRGQVKELHRDGLFLIEKAENLQQLRGNWQLIKEKLLGIKENRNLSPLKIGIVGEIYTVIEPMVNLNLEDILGAKGVEVDRSLYLSHWIKHNLVLENLPGKKNSTLAQIAKPYLGHFVGGHGLESIGQSILYAQAGFDGVIHLGPFTCMPEIVAQSILPNVSKNFDFPILSLSLDEHSGQAGIVTRIEAFLDLLENKREERRKQNSEVVSGY